MAVERSEVQFGHSTIPFVIHRSPRQKTVAVRVDPVEGVSVRAPRETPVERLDHIVRGKSRWILDRRRRVEDLPPAPIQREFVSGETFMYLGRQYRLRLERERGLRERAVRLAAGRIYVPVRNGERQTDEVRAALVGWYREKAAQRLPERVAIWAAKIGVEPRDVLIRDQRKRWGSVDTGGNIRLNWRIIQASMGQVDYVVVHELVHLIHNDHTQDFWSLLGTVMGDYESRREKLRRAGRSIVW
ncbi:MAG: SprT family zinc-dependent metalloprotease [Myxococcota bacterium]